jgi:hypothetical protein
VSFLESATGDVKVQVYLEGEGARGETREGKARQGRETVISQSKSKKRSSGRQRQAPARQWWAKAEAGGRAKKLGSESRLDGSR